VSRLCKGGAAGAVKLVTAAESEEAAGAEGFVEAAWAARGVHVAGGVRFVGLR
jgi:hypothetical protein